MTVEGTVPRHHVEHETNTSDPMQAVQEFLAAFPKARVEQIDRQYVRGICKCGRPVMEDDTGWHYDPDTQKYLCAACRVYKEKYEPRNPA